MSVPTRWDLGWNADWEQQAGPGEGPIGRVAVEQRGALELSTDEGVLRARSRGRAMFAAESRLALPAVGDWVRYAIVPGGDALVTEVLPRRTCLVRSAAGRRTEAQIIAANVDVVLVVTSAGRDFNPRRIQRYLSAVGQSGASPVVVISKIDLADDVDELVRLATAAAPGVDVLTTSWLTGEGVDRLAERLPRGVTAVVVGTSGAGKSSLVNALVGEARQAVNAVREADSRGRHTTTHRELVPLASGGVILDTPGMRELALWADDQLGVAGYDDIEGLAQRCRFRDCRHRGEPGCAVVAAIEADVLPPERLSSWQKLEREVERQRERQGGLAEYEARRARKRFAKTVREITKRAR